MADPLPVRPVLRPTTAVPAESVLCETWDVHYLRNPKTGARQRAGYRQTVERRVIEANLERHCCQVVEVLRLVRFGTPTEVRLTASSVETPAGQPVRFAYQLAIQPGSQQIQGEIVGDRLHCQVTLGGQTMATSRAWPEGGGGLLAVEQSLRRQPMRPGERRAIDCLQAVPILGDIDAAPLVTKVELVAEDHEEAALLAGRVRLLRIRARTMVSATDGIDSTVWTDPRGEVLKMVADALGQETFRTTRELAMREDAAGDIDLGLDLLVPVDRPWSAVHATRRAEYNVTVQGGDPTEALASCLSQDVQSLSSHTARVTVRRIRPDEPPEVPAAARPVGAEDLQPNGMIQSADPEVAAMARAVAAAETEPWAVAVALERHVHEHLTATDFSQVFASAAQVARSRQGDCTEHAVLLAALCRARSIPARVAFGLVYVEPYGGFLYHMWNEVWVRDRWIPLDATLGQGGIGAAHLKFADSSLQGAAAYTGLLPLADLVGRLKIDVVRID